MRNHPGRSRLTLSLACLLGLLLLTGGIADAKKGGGGKPPPPDPDPVDVGTIYFQHVADNMNTVFRMDPDGANKAPLPFAGPDLPVVQSSTLHDGLRWFLQLRPLQGQTYPGGHYTRVKLWAVAVDADTHEVVDEVELLDDPTLRFNTGDEPTENHFRWATDGNVADGKISTPAIRHLADGTMADYGLHVFHLDWDTMTLAWDPVVIDVGTLARGWVYPETKGGYYVTYDWSPDGAAIAYSNVSDGSEICVSRAVDGWAAGPITATPGDVSDWSPDGATISFYGGRDTGIYLIAPDGSDERLILADEPVFPAYFSPSGTHLVHKVGLGSRDKFGLYRNGFDIHVTSLDGQVSTNLTKDLGKGTRPSPLDRGWCAD